MEFNFVTCTSPLHFLLFGILNVTGSGKTVVYWFLGEDPVGLTKETSPAFWGSFPWLVATTKKESEELSVSHQKVSGFPKKRADLRGSRGTSGEVCGTSGKPLDYF